MMQIASSSLALIRFGRFGGHGGGGAEIVLLLVGLCFAGVLFWAIGRSGRSTTH